MPAFAALAGLLGLQLEGLAFVPILGLCLLLFHREVGWRPLLVGLGVLGLLLLPYGIHDVRHGWDNARGLLDYAGGESRFSWDAVRYVFELTGSRGIDGQAGPFAPAFRRNLGPLEWLNGVLEVALVGGVIYAVVQVVRGETVARRRTFALLLIWFAVPVLLQIRTSAPTQPHYFVMLYPVQYLLIAAGGAGGPVAGPGRGDCGVEPGDAPVPHRDADRLRCVAVRSAAPVCRSRARAARSPKRAHRLSRGAGRP